MKKRAIILYCYVMILTSGVLDPASAREPYSALHGMVVSAESHASEVGLHILQQGGNAVDAAVAVGFALAVTYKGYNIYSMPPPSSGGIALIQFLHIFEHFPLKDYGYQSAKSLHIFAEAAKRVFADRAEYLGDPDYYHVPVQGLLSQEYGEVLAKQIDPNAATWSSEIKAGNPPVYESLETTHFSVIDKDRMSVACTVTLNSTFGSLVVVDGGGFLLNNEMDDFSLRPGFPNQFGLIGNSANAIEAEKRMLSSMTPTILTRDDGWLLTIGSPGGPKIITSVLQAIVNIIEYRMNIQEAVDAPRVHQQWLPDRILFEKYGVSGDTQALLASLGHHLEAGDYMCEVLGIVSDPGTGLLFGGVDRRRYGKAAGY